MFAAHSSRNLLVSHGKVSNSLFRSAYLFARSTVIPDCVPTLLYLSSQASGPRRYKALALAIIYQQHTSQSAGPGLEYRGIYTADGESSHYAAFCSKLD